MSSSSSQLLKFWGSVSFESKSNLQITAGVISDHLLAGVPFGNEQRGLREEVPAVALTKDVLGLTFVLYGECDGERCVFSLEAMPGKALHKQFHADSKTVDIGKWLAQLIRTIPEFTVIGSSPIELQPD
jgi:hypothetical protein